MKLTRKLAELGFTDEQLDLMDRIELTHTWSTAAADGRDKSVSKLTAEQPRALIIDPTVAERQLEFEQFKFEQEIKRRQQQLKAESAMAQRARTDKKQIRADREFQIHLQQEQLHAAAKQHELELAAHVEANALRHEQFQAQGNRNTVQEDRRNSIVKRAKRYGDILKNTLP